MVDLLRFVLTNFWPFVGACILLTLAGEGVAAVLVGVARIIAAFRSGATAKGGE